MSDLIEKIDAEIAELETALAVEQAKIASAIAAKQIGDHYWLARHRIEEKIFAARAVRAVEVEVLS